MRKKKFSFDLLETNRLTLESLKKGWHTECTGKGPSYGNIINELIDTFGNLPSSVSQEMITICKEHIKQLQTKMTGAGIHEYHLLDCECQSYLKMAKFFNNGVPLELEIVLKEAPAMRKTPMRKGYLICPTDYILLNPDDAPFCYHASVVECRNAEYGVPHFVYFSNVKAVDYDATITDRIEKMCCQEWSRFENILQQQIELKADPMKKGAYLNAKEYLASPIIGHFTVYEQDDPTHPSGFQPPMGVMITRE